LAGLLSSAVKAGAEVMTETIAMGAENTPDGVKVLVRGKSGEQTLEARAAIACGYQAVKAIEKEFNGQKGYPEYINWWQQAFAFNTPEYAKTLGLLHSLHSICSDEDIDYIYNLFRDRIGIPVNMVARNLELIKEGRPELYEKLTNL